MKAKQSKTPRALATGTRLACADNTGARTVQIISVFGYHGVRRRQPKLGLGDLCTASVQKGTPDMRRKLVRAVVIRAKKEMRRPNGIRVSFEDNAVVVVDEKNEPKGTEIKGPVAREVAERFPKLGSMATIRRASRRAPPTCAANSCGQSLSARRRRCAGRTASGSPLKTTRLLLLMRRTSRKEPRSRVPLPAKWQSGSPSSGPWQRSSYEV